MILVSLKKHQIHYAMNFGFKIEYEALFVGLRLAKEVKIQMMQILRDSQLNMEHYHDKGANIRAYLEAEKKKLIAGFKQVLIQ